MSKESIQENVLLKQIFCLKYKTSNEINDENMPDDKSGSKL